MVTDDNNNPIPPFKGVGDPDKGSDETARLGKEAADAATAEAARLTLENKGGKTAEELEAERKAAEQQNGTPNDTPGNDTSIIFENEDGTEVTYKLNEKGDAINEDGSIFKTSAEIATLSSTATDENEISINDIAKISGINIIDDKGAPIEFDSTIEGFAKREVAIADQYMNQGYNKALEDLYKSNPEIPILLQHKKLYGNLDSFGKAIKYQDINIDADNKDLHKSLIIEAEIARGRDIKAATKLADMYIADGSSHDEAKSAHQYLLDKQKQLDAAQAKTIADAQEDMQRKAETYYGVKLDNGKVTPLNIENSVYDKIVKKGVIGEFKIPETGVTVKQPDGKTIKLSREELFNYMSIVDSELGMTRAEAYQQQYLKDTNNYILHNLRMLMGYDFNQLIVNAVGKKQLEVTRRIKLKPATAQNNGTTGQRAKLPFQQQ